MAEEQTLAVDDGVDDGVVPRLASGVAGVLVTCVMVKLVLSIISYAETSVNVLAGSVLGEQTRLAKELFDRTFARPFGLWRRMNFFGDNAHQRDIDGDREAEKRVRARESGKTKGETEVFARPVQKDDNSSDDIPDEDALGDNVESLLDGLSDLVKVVLDAFAEKLQDSYPPVDTRGTSILFGELLRVCDQLSATTFAEVMERTNARDIVKTDEGAHWDVFRVTTTGGATVLKVLRVEYIARYAQQLCNHLLVARALERLSDERSSNFTTGFILVTRALCVWDGYPRELSDACRQFAASRRDIASRIVDHIVEYRQVPQPYLVLQIEYTGIPLSTVETLSAAQVVSVFRQVILTLAVAETAFNFEHRHLSLDNIYLTRTQKETLVWIINGKRYHVFTRGVVAHVADFSAARADIDEETQFCDPGPIWEDCKRDRALKDIHRIIRDDISAEWSVHCPRTNVLYAYHVTRELVERFAASHRRDADETAEWEQFQTWKFRLPWFPSVAEFARDAFAEASRTLLPSSVVAKMGRFVTRSLASLVGDDR
ncbi:hypothetical protein MRX96_056398 [Rhipicephalus microplus]